MTCQGNIVVRKFASSDLDELLYYLHNLTTETKGRFGPHAFDAEGLIQFYNDHPVTGFIALDVDTNTIIAYSIIRDGILEHDKERLMGYQYLGLGDHACTYAPSVADSWQGKGIGRLMFDHILQERRQKETRRIILWGGVQNSNKKALHFYQKLGFITIGHFEYNGLNQDMLLEI